MPLIYLLTIFGFVIVASGVTIFIGYSAGLSLALPAIIAAVGVRLWARR